MALSQVKRLNIIISLKFLSTSVVTAMTSYTMRAVGPLLLLFCGKERLVSAVRFEITYSGPFVSGHSLQRPPPLMWPQTYVTTNVNTVKPALKTTCI